MSPNSVFNYIKTHNRTVEKNTSAQDRLRRQLRAILYARISRDEQGKDGKVSLDQQINRCREYAERNNMIVVGEYREDYTGTKHRRPEMDKVMQAFSEGEADALIVMCNDRRNQRLKAECEQKIILADATRQGLEDQAAEIEQELGQATASVENLGQIYDLAPKLREKLDSATWEDLRWLVETLDVRVTILCDEHNPKNRWMEVRCVFSPSVFYRLAYSKKSRDEAHEGPYSEEELGHIASPILIAWKIFIRRSRTTRVARATMKSRPNRA